ncbi:2'-5' RNA ligase family protein [Paractinoplanes lichenicola]|uniref:2'-5' RNA ligase family protein n=1 Tax=Paractinoplanes lichenicola TaxID=2802976 RepID=A0ABS1VW48_9ACTN|nr:2'-5' RNA ligase family protein [Actinoplanes lichenicola]MBL7258687.1 2'-5' RNA ligase family protein [Actinoplanes lichenicola]
MHTVELLPDDELDSRVREMWGLLGERGLASHPHPTNRPHLTVVTAPSLDGLPELALPIEVEIGPPRMLGRALVLPVTPNAALRDMHELVWSSLAEAWPPAAEWVPHISLALRFPEGDHTAREMSGPATGTLTKARSYDSVTRTVRDL